MAAGYYNQAPKRFSRRWWISRGQTPLWVVVVTVLIWVYADLEFTKTKDMKVILDVRTNPDMTILGESSFELTVTVQGNANAVEQFEQSLKANKSHLPVEIGDLRIGRTRMPVAELLARNEDFQKSGLSIVSSAPLELRFELDHLVVKPVPVQFEYSGAKLLAQATAIEPQSVRIRCAASRWLEIEQAISNTPVIRTQEVNLRDYAPGRPQSVSVPLLPQIGNVLVELVDQTHATVGFQIDRVTKAGQVQVNVRLLTPRVWGEDDTWREYKLEVFDPEAEWRPMVNVTGTPEALEQLLSRGKEIKAFVELTDDDKAPVDSWLTRVITVLFPADLNVELDRDKKHPEVRFKLVKRR